jgi:hypothetical protein
MIMKLLFAFLAAVLLASSVEAQPLPTSRPGHEWGIQNSPVAATQATISKAAVANTRHVATSVTVCISAVAAQPGITFNLRDGATGAGSIIWTAVLANSTVGGSTCVTSPPLNLIGSSNTAMTLESVGAPAATNFATVSLTGYSLIGY